MMEALIWLPAAMACGALLIALLNVLTWDRGRLGEPSSVSALIPARNEANSIEATVRSLVQDDVREIIVYNDGSTDGTGEILADLQREIPRLRVLNGVPLPKGWVGKPHACARLGEAATGDILLFVDADVTMRPDGVRRLVGMMDHRKAAVGTVVPRQEVVTLTERLIVPLLHLTYVAWLPQFLVWATRSTAFLAANGQVMAFRRASYEAIGGFESVRHEVVDDMAIARRAKKSGHRVVFGDGHDIAECRMYESAGDVWRGFSKNIHEGVGGVFGVAVVLALYAGTFIAPYLLLLSSPWTGLWLQGLVGVGANMALRALLVWRHGQSGWTILHHPVAVIGLMMIALNSVRWALGHRIEWAGRVYTNRRDRLEAK